MDFADSRRKPNFTGKIAVAAALTVMCIIVLKQSPGFSGTNVFSRHEIGVTHVLVTGGAGYIGSHATLRLLKDNYRVTIVDNLSRGNMGAVRVLQRLFPQPGRLQFIYADLGDAKAVNKLFSENAFDAVMHFAAVAYVGESTMEPLRYYHKTTCSSSVCCHLPPLPPPHGVRFPSWPGHLGCAPSVSALPGRAPISRRAPKSPPESAPPSRCCQRRATR
jgi:UDP-arabinose 4-epimerase